MVFENQPSSDILPTVEAASDGWNFPFFSP
jgi:hypothetical protein